jgi:hypothetical protein
VHANYTAFETVFTEIEQVTVKETDDFMIANSSISLAEVDWALIPGDSEKYTSGFN